MARANPYVRRKAAALKFAKALQAAAEAALAYNRVRRECEDDPRASQADDGVLRLQVEMTELASWLESAAPTWPDSYTGNVPPDERS
jgi:hypothetical protein